MRRIIIIGTAIAVLVGASAAYASFNSYTATFKFTPNRAGSTKSHSPLGMTLTYNAFGTAPDRAAPLSDLKTTIYGVVADGKDFAKCSVSKIANAKSDKVCPAEALVAKGYVNSLLGPGNNGLATAPVIKCNPGLDVWNAGQGHLVFFFTAVAAKQCGGLETGAAAPYPATVKQSGKNLVLDVPQPADVSTKVANITNFYSTLAFEKLTWKKLSKTVKGKKVAFLASVACKNGKRPWTQAFTAVNFTGAAGGATSTSRVSGSEKCTK